MKKLVEESWLIVMLGAVFAVLLAATQTTLGTRIEANKAAALNQAIEEVVAGTAKTDELTLQVDGKSVKAYKCLDASGQLVGWAVDLSGGGFIDKIRLVAGLSPTADRLLAIKVIEHQETPGLGNKIDAGNPFPAQFAGKAVDTPLEVVKHPAQAPHEIQAITGATWSSRYTTDIVNEIIAKVRPQLLAAAPQP